MEFKIDKTAFANALGWVQSVVERKTTMPILTHVLLEGKGSCLTLTTTDLEVTATDQVRAEVSTEGKVAVPARQLYDIVKELPDSIVHVKQMDNFWVQIRCAKSRYKLVGLDGNEFPKRPSTGEGKEIQLDGKTMLEMLNKTSFTISSDESRYNLNGIFWEVGEQGGKSLLRMVATDGHRLSMVERPLEKKASLPKGVIVPKKGIAELRRLFTGEGETCRCVLDDKHIRVDFQDKTLVMRLIDGQFPQYNQVIPKKLGRVLTIDKNLFVQALRRVSVVTNTKTRGVKFSISPGNLEIGAQNADLGEAKEEMSVQYKGPSFEIGFNAFYFMEVLSVTEDENVVIQLGDEVSPCLLQSEKDSGFTHVIMPMRL